MIALNSGSTQLLVGKSLTQWAPICIHSYFHYEITKKVLVQKLELLTIYNIKAIAFPPTQDLFIYCREKENKFGGGAEGEGETLRRLHAELGAQSRADLVTLRSRPEPTNGSDG